MSFLLSCSPAQQLFCMPFMHLVPGFSHVVPNTCVSDSVAAKFTGCSGLVRRLAATGTAACSKSLTTPSL